MRGYASTRNGQVHYRHEGTQGPALVCFHEAPLSSAIYAPALPVLARSFRAWAFDTPGYGFSDPPLKPPSIDEYVSTLVAEVRSTGLPIVIEPGRVIAGPSGALVARVVDLKPRDAESEFAIIDAGMTELLRPALYGAYHRIEPVSAPRGVERDYEVVGPVCESSDVVGRDRRLPRLEVGDLVAIRDAGAYGSVMASNYNRRPLPAEVLVDNGAWRVVRRRQTVDDMIALET